MEFITEEDERSLQILNHSTSHILAWAVKSLFENAKLGIGPSIKNGFYYDFLVEKPFTPEDIERIENKMRELLKGEHEFERKEIPKEEAKKLFKDEGIEKKGFTQKEEDVISFYLNRSMNFFVFDIVSLSEDINHIAPVIYRFNTNYFYYPLVTSSVIKGEGKIELVIFTNQGGISEKILRFISPHPWKVSETAIVTGEEMEKIYKELPKLMGAHAIMGVVQYRGPYNFSYDILIEMPIYQIKPYNPYKKQKE